MGLCITDKIAESSSTLKQVCDELEVLSLDNFHGSMTEYARRCKIDIARLKGMISTIMPTIDSPKLYLIIFDTLVGGTGLWPHSLYQ